MPTDVDELAELLTRASRRLRRDTSAALAPLGLSPHQSRALRVIGHCQPVRLTGLAERLRIAPRSATEVVVALTDAGWVERSPDPGDRRATLLALTASGHALLGEVDRVRHEEAERLFATLDAPSRRALGELLARL